MKRVTVLLLAISLFACGSGDNSAVRAFYPTVQPGDALPELIAEGEKAQVAEFRLLQRNGQCGRSGNVSVSANGGSELLRPAKDVVAQSQSPAL